MKVSLRVPINSDFQVLESLRNDPLVQRQLMVEQFHYSPAQVRAWIRRRTNDSHGVLFVIDSDGPCGFAQLTRINRKQGTADFGICLVRSVFGKGIGVEALRLLEGQAKRKFRCAVITLRVLRINHRAIAFYRKMKFAAKEIKRRHYFDGSHWRDVMFMEKRLR